MEALLPLPVRGEGVGRGRANLSAPEHTWGRGRRGCAELRAPHHIPRSRLGARGRGEQHPDAPEKNPPVGRGEGDEGNGLQQAIEAIVNSG